eukprot:2592381-Amphidinium_carterae.1
MRSDMLCLSRVHRSCTFQLSKWNSSREAANTRVYIVLRSLSANQDAQGQEQQNNVGSLFQQFKWEEAFMSGSAEMLFLASGSSA